MDLPANKRVSTLVITLFSFIRVLDCTSKAPRAPPKEEGTEPIHKLHDDDKAASKDSISASPKIHKDPNKQIFAC